MRHKTLILLVLSLVFAVGINQAQGSFRLTILHTNDTHANHLPDSNGNGGIARQANVVQQVRAQQPNTLLVDTGDRFSGTLFHTLYQGQDQQQLMNALGYNAMVLGNHEFINGDEVLAAFLRGLNVPVVVSNLTVHDGVLAGLIAPYAIIEIGGQEVGVIGIVTADTPELARTGEALTFERDYVSVVNATAETLTAQGVNKIILLSHVSYDEMQEVMTGLIGVDVVIGGDTHVYNSNTLKGAEGAYPIFVEGADGARIAYAQAGANNIYMGRMDIVFDAEGKVTSASGDVIWLSRYITPDPVLEELVAELFAGVQDLIETPLGVVLDVALDGRRNVCRVEACAMGSVMADAMRFATNAQIGLMNGGGVRAGLEAGEVRVGDIMQVNPFGNTIITFSINGATLKEMLENGATFIRLNDAGEVMRADSAGRFLQVSGLRYTYDPKNDVGQRIISVEVEASDGVFAPLDPNAIYTVATNSFVYGGGDGFTMLPTKAFSAVVDGRYDYEILIDYLLVSAPFIQDTLSGEARITATVPIEAMP